MATRSFLNQDEFQKAQRRFQVVSSGLGQSEGLEIPRMGKDFSIWLGEILENKFSALDGWEAAQPIALGSWARDELCPKSDIDILFCGDESAVETIVQQIQNQGLKLRYRMPSAPEDWTVGVEPFDILAILHARAFHWPAAEKLASQQSLIQTRGRSFRQTLLGAMREERIARNERYDSISNFLEPNLKYGSGGLRDLQQALYVHELFPERFFDAHHALQVLDYYKHFFLTIRQKLHLLGGGEVLAASEQLEISQWMGFNDAREFMKELQTGLSRVSFFADWMVARALASKAKISEIEAKKISTLTDAVRMLKQDSSLLAQGKVRSNIEPIVKSTQTSRAVVGRVLNQNLKLGESADYFEALFRSRVMELCLPELERVKGLSQHDHYHRFTVDAHIAKAVKILKEVYDKPKIIGRLAEWTKEFKDLDWKILTWTCLYHDLAKGKGGDHSTKGSELVKKDFVKMSLSLRLTVEVAWMVQNHLVLSTAAFRMNPQSSTTWKKLHEWGVKDKRLLRLAVFTAIDIKATNPEAWTDWKEQLLYDLVKTQRSSSATRFMNLLSRADAERVHLSHEFIQELDPVTIEGVPSKTLLADYQKLRSTKSDLPFLIVKNKRGEIWIRFHRKKDEAGLFYQFVQWLYAAGCPIQQSSIKTFEKYGVYDWFQVKTARNPAQLKKKLEIIKKSKLESESNAKFESVTLVSEDEMGLIISLRGSNKKGLLVSAARAFHELGAEIQWAKVHTWGRQIDDVFCVLSPLGAEELIAKLSDMLVDKGPLDRLDS